MIGRSAESMPSTKPSDTCWSFVVTVMSSAGTDDKSVFCA